jgi:hypothetical protein
LQNWGDVKRALAHWITQLNAKRSTKLSNSNNTAKSEVIFGGNQKSQQFCKLTPKYHPFDKKKCMPTKRHRPIGQSILGRTRGFNCASLLVFLSVFGFRSAVRALMTYPSRQSGSQSSQAVGFALYAHTPIPLHLAIIRPV